MYLYVLIQVYMNVYVCTVCMHVSLHIAMYACLCISRCKYACIACIDAFLYTNTNLFLSCLVLQVPVSQINLTTNLNRISLLVAFTYVYDLS